MNPEDVPTEPRPGGFSTEAYLRIADRCARYEDELQAGQRPTSEAYLADVADPAEVAELRRQLAALDDDYASGRGAWPHHVLGEFQLLERIGEGGMGVVYRACRRSGPGHDGDVALKIIRHDLLGGGTKALRRFRLEFEIARALDVPGVVPVYELGCEGDRHYYSMRYVDGPHLGAWMREQVEQGRPPTHDRVAELLGEIAEVVHRAHEGRVVHRDLKPSNILIERRTGRPWVADFGLARRLEDVQGLTSVGDAPGTPAYMAPEQVGSGETPVGPRIDIYSLGAVLYTALTGRPPFDGRTRDEILLKVLHTRPARPRDFDPSIPRELEAICLKCLEPDPRDRYTSARALAEDLGRWRQGLPTRAAQVTLWSRSVRYVRRHPEAVLRIGLGACAVLACAAALGLGYHAWWTDKNYHEFRNHSLNLLKLVENNLHHLPGNAETRKRLLESVLDLNDVLQSQRPVLPWWGTPPLELAQAHEYSAEIDLELGHLDEALKHCESALQSCRVLPHGFDRWVAEARIHNQVGRIARDIGDLVKAGKQYDEAGKWSGKALEECQAAPDQNWVTACLVQAEIDFRQGELAHYGYGGPPSDKALRYYRNASQLLRGLSGAGDTTTGETIENDLARVLGYLGDVYTERGRYADTAVEADGHFKEAENCYGESLKLRKNLYTHRPRSPQRLFQYARGLSNFTTLETRRAETADLSGDASGARTAFGTVLESLEEVQRLRKQLVKDNQSVIEYGVDLAWTLYQRGRLLDRLGNRHQAIEALEAAEKRFNELAAAEKQFELHPQGGDSPASVDARRGLAWTLLGLAGLKLRTAEEGVAAGADEARDRLRRADELFQRFKLRPDDFFERACIYTLLGDRDDRALKELERALGGGFRDRYALKFDPNLAPLRDRARPEFDRLLAKYRIPPKMEYAESSPDSSPSQPPPRPVSRATTPECMSPELCRVLLSGAQRTSSFPEMQSGLSKGRLDQMRFVSKSPHSEVEFLVQLFQIPAHHVAHLHLLQVLPAALVPGAQIGGVTRQGLHPDPAAGGGDEPLDLRPARDRRTIPDHHQPPPMTWRRPPDRGGVRTACPDDR